MPNTTTRAQEIRAELDKLAPCPNEGPVTAKSLARHLLTEAQITWERNWVTPGLGSEAVRLHLMGAHFAAAHALLSLDWIDEGIADAVAEEIRDAWNDGGMVGHWIAKGLGDDAERIADLAQDLAQATPKPAGVVLDPADVQAVLTAKGPLDDALYDRLAAAAGVKPARTADRGDHCPRCFSPDPAWHPAMQPDGGEVEVCPHPWHSAAAR